MAMLIVSDDEFTSELISIRKPEVQFKEINRGRPINSKEVPEVIREIASEQSISSDITDKETAKKFGISKSSLSAYKVGATSTASYNEPDESLKAHNDMVRERIIRVSRRKLFGALKYITDDKLKATKARDLAGIAKDMSAIIDNVTPQAQSIQNNQVVIYTPRISSEENYEVIHVNE